VVVIRGRYSAGQVSNIFETKEGVS
jgi:hypothetical protein